MEESDISKSGLVFFFSTSFFSALSEMSVRRPDLATEYVAPPYVAPDELPPDFMALLSLLCGLVGICIKVCVSTCVLAYSASMYAAVTRQSVEGGVAELLCVHIYICSGRWLRGWPFTHACPRWRM